MERLPELSMDLIDELDKIFPLRLPRVNQTEREIWLEVGKREVIEYLISLKNKQVKRRKLLPGDDEGDNDV
jgi:hypothetical protein